MVGAKSGASNGRSQADDPARVNLAAPRPERMPPSREGVIFVCVLVAAALFRLYGLGERSLLWQDELSVWEYALTGDAHGAPGEAPLYTWLQFLWMWWIHAPTTNTMQLLSIGLGVLDVAVAFWLGRLIAGGTTGLLAAALLAITPLALALSHEVRPYVLFMATSGLLLSAALLAWERDTIRSWLVYGATLAAAAASHLLALQICVALAVTALASLWFERGRAEPVARFLRFASVSIVFGLVGLSWLLDRPSQAYLLTGPHTDGVLDFLQNFVMSLGGATRAWLLPGLGVTALASLGLWDLARRHALRATLLGSVIVISALVTWANLAPMTGANWLGWQRYLAHLLIPYLVLVAIGAQWLAGRAAALITSHRWRWLARGLLLLPLALVAPGTAHWFQQPSRHRMVANLEVYATFACQQQHRVRGQLLVETVHESERWLSVGAIRRRNAYHLVRHDRLDTYGVGRKGIYAIQNRPGRGGIAEIPREVPLSSPPDDGPYIVFPPTFGCEALSLPPLHGIAASETVVEKRWGLICDLRFQ